MIEETIISNLVLNEEYARTVAPYIKPDYFDEPENKLIFNLFRYHVNKYKSPPSKEALKVMLDSVPNLSEEQYNRALERVESVSVDPNTDKEWLVDETEKFCQDRDLHNAIHQAILILQGEDKKHTKGDIPKLLSDSLGVCFDSNVGHDYIADAESRFDFYHRREEKIPFDIEIFNKITGGGIPKKSLTVFMAESGGGKTILKCHMAATHFMYGKNVLYITMEMAEERISERIDVNLLNVTHDELYLMSKETMLKRVGRIKDKTPGRLIVKEYPTASAHVGHFRHLLNELRTKEKFVPDVVYIDYLNICASSRMTSDSSGGSYAYVKSIAEEVRGLAMEFNVPIISSTQFNRGAYGSSDVDMTAVSESMGLVYTVDALFAIINSEELSEMKQVMIKQLKNRWGDLGYYRRFVVGMDKSKMRLYNVDDEQGNEPVAPQTPKIPSNSSKPNLFNVG